MTPPADFDLNTELQANDFRVSVFGSARIKPEDPIYQDIYQMAYKVGEMEVDLITGGGPGLMEAASKGHKDGDKANKAHTIGLNIRLPFEQEDNPALEMVDMHDRFSTRLDEFMLLSNVVVVAPGGIGTSLELFYTWQLMQVKHICHIPIILVGEMWHELVNWVIDNPLKHKYMDSEDLNGVVCVNNGQEAFELIKKAKEKYDKGEDQECQNWRLYGAKFNQQELDGLT